MLSMHVKDAEKKKNQLKSQFTSGSLQVQKASEALSDTLLTTINEDVSAAYLAERHIETELRNVERLLISNATQTEQWASVLNRLSTELKELGDITNWLDILEKAAVEIRQLSRKV